VQAFFTRWVERLPWPVSRQDRAAGYHHRLSLWQVEVSLTHIFYEPQWGRRWFEAVIRENLDLGRPDRVSLLFPTRLTRATPPPGRGYRTRVILAGVVPTLHVAYKHIDLKQYLKDGWGLRSETTFNDPTDVQPTKALETLPHLRAVGCQINTRLLAAEQLSQAWLVPAPLVARVQRPGVSPRRVPALRLGDPRVLALLQALCSFGHLPQGFRHRELRPLVARRLGRDLDTYSASAMTYDLRRLRRHGLIQRVPRTFRYTRTRDGRRLAFGLSRIYLRLLQPDWAALDAPAPEVPEPVRAALYHLDRALHQLLAEADDPVPTAA
jgi:DNA-binding transcriptional ArsR family regulator